MEGVSDLSRNDRQQYIILQLLDEIKDFRSLGELSNFISTLEDAFIIDENLSLKANKEQLYVIKREVEAEFVPNIVVADLREEIREKIENF